jgi:hypothetical protein
VAVSWPPSCGSSWPRCGAISGSGQDEPVRSPTTPHPHTAEERREGARQSHRKYFTANREAIYARRAKRAKREQAAIEAVQKGPSAPSPQGELEDPRAAFLRRRDG